MRKFHNVMSFSSTDVKKQIKKLKRVFHIATAHASALQQPTHSESKEIAKNNALSKQKSMLEIEDAIKDLAMALSGREIIFVEKKK